MTEWCSFPIARKGSSTLICSVCFSGSVRTPVTKKRNWRFCSGENWLTTSQNALTSGLQLSISSSITISKKSRTSKSPCSSCVLHSMARRSKPEMFRHHAGLVIWSHPSRTYDIAEGASRSLTCRLTYSSFDRFLSSPSSSSSMEKFAFDILSTFWSPCLTPGSSMSLIPSASTRCGLSKSSKNMGGSRKPSLQWLNTANASSRPKWRKRLIRSGRDRFASRVLEPKLYMPVVRTYSKSGSCARQIWKPQPS
mmetsp:Transcript_24050/g.65086  ORF Transcript_24050/g.65086 Transcript_24050/m.65086 type:complete len:252 (+) Transcript_24050:738-1493(+)